MKIINDMKSNHYRFHWIMLASFGLLTGCIAPLPHQNDPSFAPVLPLPRVNPENNSGSLFQAGYGVGLYEDHLARRIGDTITIVLQENTSSSDSNNALIMKNDTNTGTLGVNLGGFKPFGSNFSANTNAQRNFMGNAVAGQSNTLTGDVTVNVVDVLPNGILVVRGEKWVHLSHGSEIVRVVGDVRPEDINPDNTVLSTRLADARVTYTARGELEDSSEKGWFSKLLSSVYWPF